MSFSYKTENLGLPIWGSNDKPTQDDLNYQNKVIDKKTITNESMNQVIDYITNKDHFVVSFNFDIKFLEETKEEVCCIEINKNNIYHLSFNNIKHIECLDGVLREIYRSFNGFGILFVPFDYIKKTDKVRIAFSKAYYE